MCQLLGICANQEVDHVREDVFARHLKELADDGRGLARLSVLMSDWESLWAYADNSLHFIERKPPYGGELVRLVDDGYAVGLAEVSSRMSEPC